MFNISSSVIILHLGKPAAIKSHFVSSALPLFDCVASTTQRSRKKMKRASTREALWTFLQMLSQRLSRAASPLLFFFFFSSCLAFTQCLPLHKDSKPLPAGQGRVCGHCPQLCQRRGRARRAPRSSSPSPSALQRTENISQILCRQHFGHFLDSGSRLDHF